MLMLRSSRLPPQGPVLLHLRYASKKMDVIKMLAELRQERAQIEEAIMALERLGTRTREAAWSSTSLDDGAGERAKEARPSPWQQEQAEGPSCGLVHFEARWTTTRAPMVHTRAR